MNLVRLIRRWRTKRIKACSVGCVIAGRANVSLGYGCYALLAMEPIWQV